MALPELQTLLYRVDDGIATVTLNRPDKLNAIGDDLLSWRACSRQPGLRLAWLLPTT